MNRVFALLFVATVALSAQSQGPAPGAPVVSQQEQQQPAQKPDSSNSQNASGNASAIAPQGQPDRNAPQTESGSEDTYSPWEWGTVADWAIVAFTAVLTVFTALQIIQNQRSTTLTQELERARFSVENRKFDPQPNGKVRIEYELANRGRSAARILRSANNTLFLQTVSQPPMALNWEDAPEIVQAGDQLVRENQIHSLPADQVAALGAKTLFITIVGGIEYLDIFNKVHVRRYAFMWDGEARFVPPYGEDKGYNDET